MKNKETNIECSFCEHKWFTKSKYKLISCPSCTNKTLNTSLVGKVNKEETTIIVGGINMTNKLNVDPLEIYQEVIIDGGKKGAVIKAKLKHVGKKATIIVDKKDRMNRTDRDKKNIAEFWDKHSY